MRSFLHVFRCLTRRLGAHNTELERALQDPGDHPHILLLKIIPSQSLGQILSGHLLPCLRLDRLRQLLDRHTLSSKNDLDLFTKC